jgi:protein disulfide-isomerase
MAISKPRNRYCYFFTGSDWCGWCIRLQKRGFKTPEFATWAKENSFRSWIILEEPHKPEIKKNEELQMALNSRVSTIILANATTKEGKVNFEGIEVPVM